MSPETIVISLSIALVVVLIGAMYYIVKSIDNG